MVKAAVRSGSELRKRAAAVDKMKRSRYVCASCGKTSVKRVSNAKWVCKSCDATFAGGAYALSTPLGQMGNKALEDMKSEKNGG